MQPLKVIPHQDCLVTEKLRLPWMHGANQAACVTMMQFTKKSVVIWHQRIQIHQWKSIQVFRHFMDFEYTALLCCFNLFLRHRSPKDMLFKNYLTFIIICNYSQKSISNINEPMLVPHPDSTHRCQHMR